jgi:hypothetical protein
VVVEYPRFGKPIGSFLRGNPYQALNRFLRHWRMRSQGDQVIQLRCALPKLFVEQAIEQRYRGGACGIGDNDQYSLPVQWQGMASLRDELTYILNC